MASSAGRVTAAVTTDGCRPDRGESFPAADTAFALVLAVPSAGGTGWAEVPAAATSVAQHAPFTSNTSRGADSAEITDPAASAPSPHGDRHLRLPCRLRAASPLGRAEEQPPPLAPSHLLLIMASGPAGPLVHPLDVPSPRRESHGRDRESGRRYGPRYCRLACPDGTHPVVPRPRRACENSYCKTFTLP